MQPVVQDAHGVLLFRENAIVRTLLVRTLLDHGTAREGEGGCTGDDGFHAALAEQWELTASYEIPQWHGIHDDVCVYVRRVVFDSRLP